MEKSDQHPVWTPQPSRLRRAAAYRDARAELLAAIEEQARRIRLSYIGIPVHAPAIDFSALIDALESTAWPPASSIFPRPASAPAAAPEGRRLRRMKAA